MTLQERFLRYVSINTTSDENGPGCPSAACEWDLAKLLADEMREMGVSNVRMDEHAYVYGEIPANCDSAPAIGLIAHMDTVDAVPGRKFNPRVVAYQGGDICLNEDKKIVLSEKDFPEMARHRGEHLVVTDGTTVLGADDKAGVAEIMTLCQRVLEDPSVRHGKICIGFTPDEEIGRGADLFDVAGFGADFAYTVDGGEISDIEYENFNAASAKITVHGRNIHPGSAKNRMKHAARIAMEFNAMLPVQEKPEYTEGYEGFYHLAAIHGDEENAEAYYILRDHDANKLAQKKQTVQMIADFLNNRYGEGTVEVTLRDSYHNMREIMEQHMDVIERAQKAIGKNGMEPHSVAIRGGTDGARLSFMGLPCPNLGTGGANCHGIYEYASIEDMEKMVDILLDIVRA
jgi:tripeptide aminopeptidase